MKKAYFINMKEIINRDVPCLGLYFYNNMVIYNKRLRGEFNPSIWGKYYDFTRCIYLLSNNLKTNFTS